MDSISQKQAAEATSSALGFTTALEFIIVWVGGLARSP
jgi:hypothetical protein